MAERLGQSVEVRGIDVPADGPQPLGFLGSPTVLVDGHDLEPAARLRKGSGFG